MWKFLNTCTMVDFFTSSHLQRLLHNKFVVVVGDSVLRGVYKDLVFMLQNDKRLEPQDLKRKCEFEFHGDKLIEGGSLGELHNGKDMREIRQYKTDFHLLRYYYITRCYSQYIETILLDLKQNPTPDVIIMNSCLWDITRYGPNGFEKYQKNLQRLFRRLSEELPTSCFFLWLTTLPIGSEVHGGFMLEDLSFYKETLRFDVVVSNFYAKQVVVDYNFSVLDLHHHFRDLTGWRMRDGIHWNVMAHRRITQLILTFVCRAWKIKLPGRHRAEKEKTQTQQVAKKPRESPKKSGKRGHEKPGRVAKKSFEIPKVSTKKNSHQRSYSCASNFLADSGAVPDQGHRSDLPIGSSRTTPNLPQTGLSFNPDTFVFNPNVLMKALNNAQVAFMNMNRNNFPENMRASQTTGNPMTGKESTAGPIRNKAGWRQNPYTK